MDLRRGDGTRSGGARRTAVLLATAVALILTDQHHLAELAIAAAALAWVLPTLPAQLDAAARDRPPLFTTDRGEHPR